MSSGKDGSEAMATARLILIVCSFQYASQQAPARLGRRGLKRNALNTGSRIFSAFVICLTSKMSHDHGRHDSCGLRLYSRWLHSILLSLARGMTAVVVGSGALLGLFHSGDFPNSLTS